LPQFEDAGGFSEGLSSVRKNGQLGFIDKKGKLLISPQYDNAFYFKEGLAPAMIGDKWGFIDKTGKFVIKPQFKFTLGFEEGLAAVEVVGPYGFSIYGFIDKTGRFVIEPRFASGSYFHRGLAIVADANWSWGVIDKTGRFVIEPAYKHIDPFVYSDGGGIAIVTLMNDAEGIITTEGTIVSGGDADRYFTKDLVPSEGVFRTKKKKRCK
jgi:hypothetical protein